MSRPARPKMPQNVLYRGVTSLHGLGTGVPLYGRHAHAPSTMRRTWACAWGVGVAVGAGGWRRRDGGTCTVGRGRVPSGVRREPRWAWDVAVLLASLGPQPRQLEDGGWCDDGSCTVGWGRVPWGVRREPRWGGTLWCCLPVLGEARGWLAVWWQNADDGAGSCAFGRAA